MKNKYQKILPLISLFLSLSSCNSYEKRALIYGTAMFLSYLIILVLIYTTDKFHDFQWFIKLRQKIKPLAMIVAIGGFLGSLMMVIQFSRGIKHSRLFLFESVILAITSMAIIQWVKIDDRNKQKLYIKVISIGLSVFMAVLFLIYQGHKFLK